MCAHGVSVCLVSSDIDAITSFEVLLELSFVKRTRLPAL